MTSAFYFILISLLALSFFFLIGHLFYKLFKGIVGLDFTSIFFKLLLGVIISILLFSCIITRFQTVSIGLVLIALFFWRDGIAKTNRLGHLHYPPGVYVAFLLSIAALTVGIVVYRVMATQDFYLGSNIGYFDQVFYAKVSKYLITKKVETVSLEYLLDDRGVLPYHYFDLWINSLLIKFTGQNPVKLLILSAYTIGIVLVWVGIVAMAEQFFAISKTVLVLSIPLVFYTNLYLPLYKGNDFLIYSINLSRNLVDLTKLFPVYLCLISAFLLYIKKRYELAYNVLLGLCILFLPCAPGVFIFLLLLIVIAYFAKRIKLKTLGYRLLKTITVFLFLIFFYEVFGSESLVPSYDIITNLVESVKTAATSTSINIVGGTILRNIIVMFPLLLLLLFLMVTKRGKLISQENTVLFLLFNFSALAAWVIYQHDMNGAQFYTNLFLPISFVFSLSIFFSLIKTGIKWVWIIALTQTSYIFYQEITVRSEGNESRKVGSAKSLADYLNRVPNATGVFLSNQFQSVFHMIPEYSSLDVKLQEFVNRDRFHAISLTGSDAPIDSTNLYFNQVRSSIENSTFFRYAKAHPQANIDSVRLRFIKDHKINFLLSDFDYKINHVLSDNLDLQLVDSLNRIKLYSVKY